jgi:hypothetical protein
MDNDTTIFDDIRKAYLLAVGNLDVRHERIINEREHKERLKKVEKEQKKRQRQQDKKRALAKKKANSRLWYEQHLSDGSDEDEYSPSQINKNRGTGYWDVGPEREYFEASKE